MTWYMIYKFDYVFVKYLQQFFALLPCFLFLKVNVLPQVKLYAFYNYSAIISLTAATTSSTLGFEK